MTDGLDEAKAEEFSGRLFNAAVETLDVLNLYVGDRLGLYRSLSEDGPATAPKLAKRAGIHPRYAREWLEHQAVTGIVEVDDVTVAEDERRYTLPKEHAAALVDPESPFSIAPLSRALVSVAQALPLVLEAFRTGGGVQWSDYGADGIESQGDFNRPWLVHQFGTEYLPAIADVDERLKADPPARVADVACGVGWAGIAIARAYPNVRVDGFDFDEPSIALAQQYAKDAGVADRVNFSVRDVGEGSLEGQYDLAVVIESIHDLSQPVAVLSAIRNALVPGGVAIIADEKVADSFQAPADEVERLFYGVSVLLCLPAGMADQPSAATGTVMRASTFISYAKEAGFGDVEILDLDHPLLRFYRLNK